MALTDLDIPEDIRNDLVALDGANRKKSVTAYLEAHSTLKCNTSGGGDRFSCRMMLRIGQQAATVPLLKRRRLPCPRAIAT